MTVAGDLSRLLGPLRRAVLRAARTDAALPDLPEAQIELLRVLLAHGPMGPSEVAGRLRVASSTVSNLVRTMAGRGLVERRSRPDDLRAVWLAPTEHAKELLRRYDQASSARIGRALRVLSPADRDTVERALPVLERLLRSLDERAP
jgi:DNA-binding MarR family transcriptional regulator